MRLSPATATMITGLLVVRDEDHLLVQSLQYHFDLGFDRFLVLLHRPSSDLPAHLREQFGERVRVFLNHSPEFQQRECQQRLINELLHENVDEWVFPLDADEFIWLDQPLRALLAFMESLKLQQGCIRLFDMLHVLDNRTWHADPLNATLGFFPFKERSWEQPSSFYKSFCRKHSGMEVFQGGHFFPSLAKWPQELPVERAKIFHYTNKGSPAALLKKWMHLSESRLGQHPVDKPTWWEKYEVMHERVRRYESNLDLLVEEWFRAPKTFWGTVIPSELVVRDERMRDRLKVLGGARC